LSQDYDVLIKDAVIVDGTGAPSYGGCVGIKKDRIAAVGDLSGKAATVIEGQGLTVCPGFVDPHSHADMSILAFPLADNLVGQGITTFVGGNCGHATAPVGDPVCMGKQLGAADGGFDVDWRTFGEWLSKVDREGLALNYVPLVGHNTVRRAVLGEDFHRKATSAEVEQMEDHVSEAMTSGAFGLSTGLDAAWAAHFADVEEIIALAAIAERHGGFFAPHTRHHQNQWPADARSEFGYGIFHAPKGEIITGRYHGLLEAVEIAREANRVPLHIAHFTPAYIVPQPHPRALDEAIARASLAEIIDPARDEGLDVTFNVIPWSQSIGRQEPISESFFSDRLMLPDWLRELDRETFAQKLKTDSFRQKVRNLIESGKFKFGMIHPLTDPYWMDCFTVLACADSALEGQTIGELARKRRPKRIIDAVYQASIETVFDILVDDPHATWALTIDKREYGALSVFLNHPAGMPCTDIRALPAASPREYGVPPIAYGLYPHYFRKFVKDSRALNLEEAVQKATSIPAQQVLRLEDRGVVKEGAYADLVVLDVEALRETGDFLHPARSPEGVEFVFVNGAAVVDNGEHTGQRPGQVLRRT
jgi:N-acyl-D-amino-acid deacylase